MIPRIIEVEDGRLKVTPECYTIPELKAIMDKFDMKAEPYLLYIYYHTHPESAYNNQAPEEKDENIIYDLSNTVGRFDSDDPLIKPAIKKVKGMWTSPVQVYHESITISLYKMSQYLRDKPIVEGKDGNLAEVMRMQKEAGNTIRSFLDSQKQADEELKDKMKGNNEMGEY